MRMTNKKNKSRNALSGLSTDENQKFYSFNLIQSPGNSIKVTLWIRFALLVLLVLLFIPWQQNINGNGSVISLKPNERPQTLPSTIAGRIDHWYVQEGQYVKAGDSIMKISEIKDKYFDPDYLLRLSQQVVAKEDVISSMENKIVAQEQQISALKQGLQISLEKARNKIKQVRFKVQSDSAESRANELEYQIAQFQFLRQDSLYTKGLKSLTELETRKIKLQDAQAKVVSAQNKLLSSRNELINAELELSSLAADYLDKISKAESEKNSASAYVFDSEASLAKIKNEYSNVQVRSDYYVIRAPQNGYVIRALKAGVGEIIKEGDPVVTIMPKDPQIAVEMYVSAMDIPLLSRGRHVRILFEGWPAMQFSGWPGVSIGTFGGTVSVIDYVNSENGKYRILVTVDSTNDDHWPTQLRVGSGVQGWVMLEEVPVWYEIWRQINGFPPSLKNEPEKEKDKKKNTKGSDDEE